MQRKICPHDMAYLLDHPKLMFWKRCPCCGYCEDEKGENLLAIKEKASETHQCKELSQSPVEKHEAETN
jgi:hypothetical protein